MLINAATHKRNAIEQDKILNDFRKHIKYYPNDKILFLKRAGLFYVEYNSSFDSDYLNMIKNDTLFYTPDFLSPRTKELMDSITVYQKIDQTASVMSGIYKTWGNKDAIVFVVPNAKEIMRDIDNKKRKEMKEIYDAIFIGI